MFLFIYRHTWFEIIKLSLTIISHFCVCDISLIIVFSQDEAADRLQLQFVFHHVLETCFCRMFVRFWPQSFSLLQPCFLVVHSLLPASCRWWSCRKQQTKPTNKQTNDFPPAVKLSEVSVTAGHLRRLHLRHTVTFIKYNDNVGLMSQCAVFRFITILGLICSFKV